MNNKNMEDYIRKTREKSISPSISLDTSHNQLSREEKIEKQFYSATVTEMAKELFTSFDDLMRHVNFFLQKNLKTTLPKIPENYLDEMVYNFFDNHFKVFIKSFDSGEIKVINLLSIANMNPQLCAYLTKKTKRKSLVPMLGTNANDVSKDGSEKDKKLETSPSVLSPLKKFENHKLKFAKNVRDNLSLKIQLAMERRIRQSIEQNGFDKVKDKFEFLEEQMKKKPDLSYIDKNLDIMSSKLKVMRREIRQLNQLNN